MLMRQRVSARRGEETAKLNPLGVPFLLPFALGVSLTLATVLIVLGWRGRIRGAGPHCRRCQYSLIGVSSAVCPECGLDLLETNIQSGEWKRRPVMLGFGVLLFLPTLAIVGGTFWAARSQYKWEPYLPASWLILSASSGSDDALTELLVRFNNNGLSDANLRSLADVALVKHGLSPAPSRWAEWCDTLAKIEQRGLLGETQKQRFYSQLFIFEVKARTPIRVGDPLVYGISYKNRTSDVLPFRYELEVLKLGMDQKSSESQASTGQTSYLLHTDTGWQSRDPDRLESGYGSETAFVASTPGKHELVLEVRLSLCPENPDLDQPWGAIEDESTLIRAKPMTLRTGLEILGAEAPDPVEWVTDPEVDARVRAFFTSELFVLKPREKWRKSGPKEPPQQTNEHYFQFNDRRMWRQPQPGIACALQVSISLDGKSERPLGSLLLHADGGYTMHGGEGLRLPEGTRADVFLRADKDIARRTMNVFRIWEGEIRIDNVPIRDKADEP